MLWPTLVAIIYLVCTPFIHNYNLKKYVSGSYYIRIFIMLIKEIHVCTATLIWAKTVEMYETSKETQGWNCHQDLPSCDNVYYEWVHSFVFNRLFKCASFEESHFLFLWLDNTVTWSQFAFVSLPCRQQKEYKYHSCNTDLSVGIGKENRTE